MNTWYDKIKNKGWHLTFLLFMLQKRKDMLRCNDRNLQGCRMSKKEKRNVRKGDLC